MALDVNLMGLGMSPGLAQRIANGGTGPVVIAGKGSSLSTATQIGGKQFVTFISGGAANNCVAFPALSGGPMDVSPEIADDFVIHNGNATSCTVFLPSGVTLNVGGSAKTGSYTLATVTTLSLWVVSTTQLFGIQN